ncbi:uncharacterized protein MELLADRAFT_37534 [Melampsora larici-populina 98AG31]|uniref:Secreted protein n=1 Tax=Melampsora larici-populina (strain 98AG31 / pathotype 3-4-7) TaxID=747676 RepID=F4RTN6_MELLP|nr:uncharacterized protein MELLADRAFT_37534 [Melampsora larici-populina 98AG31]EGG04290.1 secreted protein [Melampsora larici-populina 98AG31]
MLSSTFLKMIVISLSATATAIAQTYRLSCDPEVQNPAGCFDYGYCAAGGFFMSCAGPPADCQSGHSYCSEKCNCIRN